MICEPLLLESGSMSSKRSQTRHCGMWKHHQTGQCGTAGTAEVGSPIQPHQQVPRGRQDGHRQHAVHGTPPRSVVVGPSAEPESTTALVTNFLDDIIHIAKNK